MEDVEDFLAQPGARDIPVGSVFTPEMFAELRELMAASGWSGIERVEKVWEDDWSARPIIAGFMKDKVPTPTTPRPTPNKPSTTHSSAQPPFSDHPNTHRPNPPQPSPAQPNPNPTHTATHPSRR